MVKRISAGSVSAKALAAAKKQGRFHGDWIYGTKAAAEQAAHVGKAQGASNKMVKVGLTPAGGWSTSEVQITERKFGVDRGEVDDTYRFKIFGDSYGDEDMTGVTELSEVEVLGIRVELCYGPGMEYCRFAAAVVVNDAAVGKNISAVAAVPGALAVHDKDLMSAWYTLNIRGVPMVRVDGQIADPKTMLYVRWQAKGAAQCEVKFHVTLRKAKTGASGHVL